MVWEAPSFIEIDMSAEIGAYQSDFGENPATPDAPDVKDAAPSDQTS